jgi:hypothetical protein
MADLELIRRTLAEGSAVRERLAAQVAASANKLSAERAKLASLRASADAVEGKAAAARIETLLAERAGAARKLSVAHERVRVDLQKLLNPTIELEGDVPLVLLPIRIEVRSTPDRKSLRVRIFHDALHTEWLDEGVSDAERQAAISYWNDVWTVGDTSAPWPALVAAVGATRAPWVSESLRPTNLSSRPDSPPQFPETDDRTARRAVARTMPDRFFVRIEQDGAPPVTGVGNAIPDELPVGLADRDELKPLQLDDQDLPPLDESLRWLIDFGEAERVGMAITVALPRPDQSVRRVLVYGVRSALDRQTGAARIERLIRSHRYTDGAEFLAQGTPTNNTDSARSDWSRRTPPGPPPLDLPANPDPGANATVTARALGIDPQILAIIPGAADRQQARAAAFNTALWTTTWGDAIEHITPAGRANGDQRLDSPALDAVRDHWVACVRGRGPLPVLRLGRQPYGVLPIVMTDGSWQPFDSSFVENRLVPFIDQQIRWMWSNALPNARSVMTEPLDTALPFILGTDAVLRALRVRTALTPDPFVQNATALTLPDLGDTTTGQDVTRAVSILSGVPEDALTETELLGTKTRSLALPLVHESDLDFVKGLLQPAPPHMTHHSVLQVLLAHAFAVDRYASDSVATSEMRGILREAVASNTAGVDRDLVTRAFDAVSEHGAAGGPGSAAQALIADATAHVATSVGHLDHRVLADRYPLPAIAPPTIAQRVGGTEIRLERLTGVAGMQLVGEFFRRSTWSSRVWSALREISQITSIDERRLLLCETLDCCSHRLDAWVTAAASRRLNEMRDVLPHGAFIGAYGWIENIELRTPDEGGKVDDRTVLHDGADGGFIHAPGITHAVTAGILRSARLTHSTGDPNNDPLDIDLSSARVRDALSLLDGMRRGQTLGALLGYRLERRLHERSGHGLELDRFIYVLRTLAPLRGGKLSEPGQPVEESLAASDVVDGLRLMEIDPATVRQKMKDGPDDQRYIQPPDVWHPPAPGEAEAVLAAIKELDQTHDAVADLLLAESVYQLASANPARAAAALDVLGAGEAIPPDPEVVRTPRSGLPIQHRIAIVIPEPTPAWLPGWNPKAPRASAEPRLERWAQGALGDATKIAVSAGHAAMLSDAQLCALDVLYDADGDSARTSTLAARLHGAIDEFGDSDLPVIERLWELAGMLRTMLLTGRRLEVADVGRPVEQGARGRVADADELVQRATAALDALKAATAGDFPVQALTRFGVRPPPQTTFAPTPAEQKQLEETLLATANKRVIEAQSLIARAAAAESVKSRIELASQALASIFGDIFMVVPRLLPPPAGEADLWSGAVGPQGVTAKAGAEIRPWLLRAGAVRSATSAYGEALLVREMLGRRPLLRVAQSPAGAYGSWVGLPFPGDPPTVPLTSMVAEVVGAASGDPEPAIDGALAGVVIDEWTEVLPRRLKKGDPSDPDAVPTFSDVTTTAIAVNANGPGARPPQAILLALSPDRGAWTDDRLIKVLDEAFALAQMRTLTLQEIPWIGRVLPALYFRDWSLQGEPVIDWNVVATKFNPNEAIKFLALDE